jgi:hypothetical protein
MLDKLIKYLFNMSEKQCLLGLLVNLFVGTVIFSYCIANEGNFSTFGGVFVAVYWMAVAILNFYFMIRSIGYGSPLIIIVWIIIFSILG